MVQIDAGLCCGSGNCAQVCSAVFELDPESNRAAVRPGTAVEKWVVTVRRAAEECPTQAIEISSGASP